MAPSNNNKNNVHRNQPPPSNNQPPPSNNQSPPSSSQNFNIDINSPNHPLYLHPNDHPGLVLIFKKLTGSENYNSWKRSMMIALNAKNMLKIVTDQISNNLNFVNSASELWAKLYEHYAQLDGYKMYQLVNDIVDLKQQNCNIEVYYHKLKGLWDEHDALESPYLCHCVCNCENGKNNVAKAYNRIRQEEKQREGILPKPLGSTSLSAQTYRNKNRPRNTNSAYPNRPQTGRRGTFRPRVYCTNYSKEGHNSDECYKLKGFKTAWVTDSGATDHISILLLVMHDTFLCNPPIHVTLPTGQTVEGLNKRIAHGNLCEGLYIIYPDQPTFTSPAVLSTSIKDSTILWHSRLEHPSISTLKQIKSLSISCNSDINECIICPLAKNHASLFPLSVSHASCPFELVHVDIWGPYKSPTINKCKFFLTIVDDFPRASWTYLIPSLLNVKPSSIPFDPLIKLNHDDGDPLDDPTQYKALVGKLLYLTITKPDISYTAQTLSQFIQAPRTPHLKALVKVLRYLKSCLGQGSCLISWKSKKQIVVSRSSTEAEYRALADITCEISWIKCLFKDLGLTISSPTSVYCDNASAIALASNLIQHARTKHIEIDCHFVRDKIRQGLILPTYIPTQHQLADVLTKGLSKAPYYKCLSKYDICDP
nr:cysteine-rich RLK (receptor-like protein kinase) 8 [Tanacetum cinerariifolium]